MLHSQAFGQGCEIKRVLVVYLDKLSFSNFHSGTQSTDEDVHSFELVLHVIKRVEICLFDNRKLRNEVLLGPAVQLSAAEQDYFGKTIVLFKVVNNFDSNCAS